MWIDYTEGDTAEVDTATMRPISNPPRTMLLFAVVVTAATIGGFAASAGADNATVGITGVDVTPAQPYPNESVTVTTTIHNSDDRSFSIDAVVIESDSLDGNERVLNPGSVPPGQSLEIPLTTSFGEPGTYELTVEVKGSIDGTQVDRRYPATVTVIEEPPGITIETADSVVGEETDISVTVANGDNRPIRNLEVDVDGESFRSVSPRRTTSQLPPRSSKTFNMTVEPEAAGEQPIEIQSTYRTTTGLTTAINRTKTIDVQPLETEVDLSATTKGVGSSPGIEVTLDNLGNARVDETVIEIRTEDGAIVDRQPLPSIASGEQITELIELQHQTSETLSVRASYETGVVEETTETTVAYTPNPASVKLTGVNVEEGENDGTILITGSASNVGLESANSVLVRVKETEGVEPAQPNEEFFVGVVAESDFRTFDLNARVTGQVTDVPIEITYIADGKQRSHVENVSIPASNTPATASAVGSDTNSSQGLLPWIAGGVIAVVVIGIIANGIYRSRSE